MDSITDVNAYERTELTLYFTDANGTLLYPEKRSVMHNVNTSVERVIIEELISGPEQPGTDANAKFRHQDLKRVGQRERLLCEF